MKWLLTTIILSFVVELLAGQAAFSQTALSQKQDEPKPFVYPVLPKYAKAPGYFVPKNWEVIDSSTGDLNKDSAEDAALILEYQDSIKMNDGFDHPRILLIAFKIKDHYMLKLQHNTLIDRREYMDKDGTNRYDDNPYNDMAISNGVLRLRFSWDSRGAGGRLQYIVRYQANDFYLIGATVERGYHADISTGDFNFSTRKYTYHEVDDERGFGGELTTVDFKKKLPARSLKKLGEIKGPFLWNIAFCCSI